jgi:hypothetical protein
MNNQFESELTPPELPQPASWSQDRRLKFIDFRLRWEGRVNRIDLCDHFGISTPQASADLSKYTASAQLNLTYNMKLKSYVPTSDFSALYTRSSTRAYLNELLALSTGVIDKKASFLGWVPEVAVAPTPTRLLEGRSLALVLRSIRDRRRLSLAYQGMSRAEPVEREISPHALAFDGFRWHARAYCHLRNQYRDFVIGRMVNPSLGLDTDRAGKEDEAWNNVLELILAPDPKLPAGARHAISMDYGMIDGQTVLSCRQALLFYALKRLGLEQGTEAASGAAQQIVLLNQAELQPFIEASQSRREL